MYAGRDFDPAEPGEREPFGFDFSRDIPAGDAINGVTWSCVVAADSTGVDSNPASRLSGAATFNGKRTAQVVADLQAGVKYVLRAVVTTVNGNMVSLFSHVTCSSPS